MLGVDSLDNGISGYFTGIVTRGVRVIHPCSCVGVHLTAYFIFTLRGVEFFSGVIALLSCKGSLLCCVGGI